jgi:uncharacterized protein with HEPN domain
MNRKSAKLLDDIATGADRILRFVTHRSLNDYSTDEMLRSAVERNSEIIGEAMNRLTKVDEETALRISHAARIVAFRNVLIHGYDLIDDSRDWDVIHNELPVLPKESRELQRVFGGGP